MTFIQFGGAMIRVHKNDEPVVDRLVSAHPEDYEKTVGHDGEVNVYLKKKESTDA